MNYGKQKLNVTNLPNSLSNQVSYIIDWYWQSQVTPGICPCKSRNSRKQTRQSLNLRQTDGTPPTFATSVSCGREFRQATFLAIIDFSQLIYLLNYLQKAFQGFKQFTTFSVSIKGSYDNDIETTYFTATSSC